jgi:hypothetical protein
MTRASSPPSTTTKNTEPSEPDALKSRGRVYESYALAPLYSASEPRLEYIGLDKASPVGSRLWRTAPTSARSPASSRPPAGSAGSSSVAEAIGGSRSSNIHVDRAVRARCAREGSSSTSRDSQCRWLALLSNADQAACGKTAHRTAAQGTTANELARHSRWGRLA